MLGAVVKRLDEALTSRGLKDEGEGRQQVGLPAPVPEIKQFEYWLLMIKEFQD